MPDVVQGNANWPLCNHFFSFAGLFLGFWAFSAFFDHFLATALLCLVKHPSYKQHQDDKVDPPTFVVNVSCSKFKPTKVLPKTLKPLNYDSELLISAVHGLMAE